MKTQILLITSSQKVADIIFDCVESDALLSDRYELTWLTDYHQMQSQVEVNYSLCLVEEQIYESSDQTTFSKAIKAPWILVTANNKLGQTSLEQGATDYWDLKMLNSATIERSLRLVLNSVQQLRIAKSSEQEMTFYRDFFTDSIDGLFSLDVLPDSSLVYRAVNDAYAKLIGVDAQYIVGKPITDILPTPHERKYLDCLFSQNPITYEYTVQVQEITQIWRIALAPVKNGHNQLKQLQGSARNVTQEKQAITQQIRHTRYRHLLRAIALKIRQSLDLQSIIQITVQELQKTLNSDRVVILEFNRSDSGTILEESVKDNFSSMRGVSISNQYYQQIPSIINHPGDYFYSWEDINNDSIAPDYRQLLQQYQVKANLVIPLIRRSAVENKSDLIAYPWGLLCVHQCSSTRKWTKDEIELLQQLGEQLNIALSQAELLASEIKQRQELARSNSELEQFAYVTSHDLQAPLQTISNYAQLLEHRYRDRLDEKADKYIDYIVSAVDRMRKQIEDLLEYSRVDRQQNTFCATDFSSIIQQAIANLAAKIEANQAEIFIASELPSLVIDRSQFITLFQNLIGNSLKYRSEQTPSITIKAELQDNFYLFSIEDNGIGIEPKFHQRIFQIFQRLHTQEEYPGTGIGLAICQKIVQRHGGKIWLKSAENDSTTFFFTVPKASLNT